VEAKTVAEPRTRQILVPIDVMGVDRATLMALVAMAERLEAGLVGLFLEDPVLSRAAALPIVREISRSGAGERDITAEALRRHASRLARTVQQQLAELTAGRRVTWRFDYVADAGSRGAAALRVDTGDVYLPAREGCARMEAPAATLQFRRVRIIYRDGEDSARAMEIVHRLARNGHTRELFVVTDRPLPAALAQALKAHGVRVHVELHGDAISQYLHAVLARPSCDLVLIPRSLFGATPDAAIEAALNRVSRPVLLVSA